jgi:uncharacterized protein YbcI
MNPAAEQVQLKAESRGPDLGRSPLLQISTEMVRLYKEAFGRGPTKARAHFAGSDVLVVTLEDSLTVAERKLVALGELDRIRETRMFFQHALEDNFRDMVERILARRPVAFVSGIDVRNDVSVEVFTFEPEPSIRLPES